jgi:hypothetical protein
MALEEARAAGTSIRETQWWGYKLKTFIEHHIFPQADRLRRLFEKIGIDVDDCVMKVPDWFSDWIHSGKGKGGWWNRKWDEFMERADRWLKQKGESWDEHERMLKEVPTRAGSRLGFGNARAGRCNRFRLERVYAVHSCQEEASLRGVRYAVLCYCRND